VTRFTQCIFSSSLALVLVLTAGAGRAQNKVKPENIAWPSTCTGGSYYAPGSNACGSGNVNLPTYTVATLPPAGVNPHLIVQVTDGQSQTDCTAGGGTTALLCSSGAGAGWTPLVTPGTAVSINGAAQGTANETGLLPYACADVSGSGSAQSCSTSPSFVPQAGNCVLYTTTTANTGASLSLAVNGATAAPAQLPGAAGWTSAITAGAVPANVPLVACYNGAAWNLSGTGVSPPAGTYAGVSASALGCDATGAADCSAKIQAACAAQPGATIVFDVPMGRSTAEYLVAATSNQTFPQSCSYQFVNGAQITTGHQAAVAITSAARNGSYTGTNTVPLSSCTSSAAGGAETFTSCPNTFVQFGVVVLTGLTHVPNCYYGCSITAQTYSSFTVANPAATGTVGAATETGSAIEQQATQLIDLQHTSATSAAAGGIITVSVANSIPAAVNEVALTGTTNVPAGVYAIVPGGVTGAAVTLACPSCAAASSAPETGTLAFVSGGVDSLAFAGPLSGIPAPGVYAYGQYVLYCQGTTAYNGPYNIAAVGDSAHLALFDPRATAAAETAGSCYVPYTATFLGPFIAGKGQQIIAHGSGVVNSEGVSYVGWYGAKGFPSGDTDDTLPVQEALFWNPSRTVVIPKLSSTLTSGLYSVADYQFSQGLLTYGAGQHFDGENGSLWQLGTTLGFTSTTQPGIVTANQFYGTFISNMQLIGPTCGNPVTIAQWINQPSNDGWMNGAQAPHSDNLSVMCFARNGLTFQSGGAGFNTNVYRQSGSDYFTVNNLFTWDVGAYGFYCAGTDCNAGTLNGSNDAHGSWYGGYHVNGETHSTLISANGENNSGSVGAGNTFAYTTLTVTGTGASAVCDAFFSAGTPNELYYDNNATGWATVVGSSGGSIAGADGTWRRTSVTGSDLLFSCPGASGGPATSGTVQNSSTASIYAIIDTIPNGATATNWTIDGLLNGGNSNIVIGSYSESTNGCETGNGFYVGGTMQEYLYQGYNCPGFTGSLIGGGAGQIQLLAPYTLFMAYAAGGNALNIWDKWDGQGASSTAVNKIIFSTTDNQYATDWTFGEVPGARFRLSNTAYATNTGPQDAQTVFEVDPSFDENQTVLNAATSTGKLELQNSAGGGDIELYRNLTSLSPPTFVHHSDGSFTGPAVAPTGSCANVGAWVFSQDGHATFCAAGTWTTKI
jgi:hypothetical protein